MSLWWLGLAIAAPPEGSDAHAADAGHDHGAPCPAAPQLAAIVGQRALTEAERSCVAEVPLHTAQGAALGWVGLVDDVIHRQREPSEELLTGLRAHTQQPTAALMAAAQLGDFPEWQLEALQVARRALSTQAWSVGWSRSHDALSLLSPEAASGVKPRLPGEADLSVCRDVGRLQARALFGGVYAVERDCAVRAAEVASNDERRAWARLSWALTLQHQQPEEEAWVRQRLVELGLDPATL